MESLPTEVAALQALVGGLRERIAELEQRLAWYTEQYRLAQHRRFAASSERCPQQLELFEGHHVAPSLAASSPPSPPVSSSDDAEAGTAKRRRGGRGPLPLHLPREEVIYDLAAEEKVCPCCGEALTLIGAARAEQLDIVPPRLKVIAHVRLKYACHGCEQKVTTAPAPAQPIPKSNASPGLLAYIVTAKIADGLPLYRQETIFGRLGVELPRSTLAAWLIRAGELVQPLINLLHGELLGRPIIVADETTLQVLKEAGRAPQTRSYLWAYLSDTGPPIVLFEYRETRAGRYPKAYLEGFTGEYLHTDGYSAYDQVGAARQVGCWNHCRRKFHDVVKARPKGAGPGLADEALVHIGTLYAIERRCTEQGLSAEERLAVRATHSRPVLDTFKAWLARPLPATLPKSLIGRAIRYALKRWARLERFLENGNLALDTNAVERAIKSVVIGRKNFLFAATVAGARALANLYSLVVTAKANSLEPWGYLTRVFSELPQAQTVEDIEALLPWRGTVLAAAG
jgi:transposase